MRLFGSTPTAVVMNHVDQSEKSRKSADSLLGLPVAIVSNRAKGNPKSGWVAARLESTVELLDQLPPIGTPAWTIAKRGKGYRLTLALRPGAQVRVGRRGDSLLLECDGYSRQFELPPVLKRCLLEGGGMRAGDLILGFVPNPRVWREQG